LQIIHSRTVVILNIFEKNIYRLGVSCGRPAAYTKKYVAGEELGIILSPKASIEGAKSRAYIGGGD